MIRVMGQFIIAMIRAYRCLLRPLLAGSCRFVPSCSDYAIEAVERHGPWRGTCLAVRRIARCHPWGGRGVDLVP